jgi:hypothetical protein
MNCTYTLTKGEIWDYRHMCHSFLRAGSVMELTLPGVGSEAFSSSDQLEDWLREDDDTPYHKYKVRFLAGEPA